MRQLSRVAAALVLAGTAAGAIEVPLDYRAIDEALAIANTPLESTHLRFHADYRFAVNAPPVDWVSVVSPFRRVVLLAETEKRQGRRAFGQREALAALRPDPGRLEVYVELTFHPLNTFVGVPDYAVVLEAPGKAPVAAADIERLPRFGPRLADTWYPFPYPYPHGPRMPVSGAQTLEGGTLIARFPGDGLDPRGVYDAVVLNGQARLAQVRIDLARLR